MNVYTIGECVITVDEEARTVTTRFPDGAELVGCPNFDGASFARAHELGYQGDTWAMSRDHELAHSWLSVQAGLTRSYALWVAAHPETIRYRAVRQAIDAEEGWVLAWQRSLDKTEPRPWETA